MRDTAAGKPGAGFGASSAQTSTTNENGGFSFKPASTSPSGDLFLCCCRPHRSTDAHVDSGDH